MTHDQKPTTTPACWGHTGSCTRPAVHDDGLCGYCHDTLTGSHALAARDKLEGRDTTTRHSPSCPHEVDGEVELSCAPCAVEAERSRFKRLCDAVLDEFDGYCCFSDDEKANAAQMGAESFHDALRTRLTDEVKRHG